MPNRGYLKGKDFEQKLAREYRAAGATVIRSAGSHGQIDLVIIFPNKEVWFVQCKRGQHDVNPDSEFKNLKIPKVLMSKKIWISKKDHQKAVISEVD